MKLLPAYFAWSFCAVLIAAMSGRVRASDSVSVDDQLSLTPTVPAAMEDPAPQFLDVPSPSLDVSATSQPSTLPTRDKIAATEPEANSAAKGEFPEPGGDFGLAEFIRHFAPYEPMYFVGGAKAPNVKFQFSIRYRIFNPDAPLATQYPLLKGFNFAYSQTSLWDFSDSNDPFFYDSSYRPEFFYYLENVPGLRLPPSWQAGLQAGIGHESNGQKDPDHRSLNILYLRPILTLSATRGDLVLIVAPKAYVYIGGLPLNPDMPKYRGYCDLRVVFGQRDGLELSTIGRLGSDFNKGSLQFDLTYPLTKLLGGNVDVSLDAQYFIGYGDTLLTYNQYSQIFRIGLALVR
jgi:phospholipase A1